MAKVSSHGLMVENIMGHMLKIRSMGMENLAGKKNEYYF